MNLLEHLLWGLAEECAEVAQRASKAARFGIDQVEPGQSLSNEDRLWGELNDLAAMCELLIEHRGRGGLSQAAVDAKKRKFASFLRLSEECGTFIEDARSAIAVGVKT